MENASKALLIAASILIVILLIAFGMQTFNSTSGTADSLKTTMSATEKASFNNKFTAYLGTKKSAAQAKALANIVISNNAVDETKTVTINIVSPDSVKGKYTDAKDITNKVAELSGSGKIEVSGESNGIITEITLTY